MLCYLLMLDKVFVYISLMVFRTTEISHMRRRKDKMITVERSLVVVVGVMVLVVVVGVVVLVVVVCVVVFVVVVGVVVLVVVV